MEFIKRFFGKIGCLFICHDWRITKFNYDQVNRCARCGHEEWL